MHHKELSFVEETDSSCKYDALYVRSGFTQSSFDEESPTLASIPIIAKVNFRMQFIRSEEDKLRELIRDLKERLDDVHSALEKLKILEENSM